MKRAGRCFLFGFSLLWIIKWSEIIFFFLINLDGIENKNFPLAFIWVPNPAMTRTRFNHLLTSTDTFSLVCLSLTWIPQLFVPVHGQDDEDVAQDVYHDGEDQHAGQRSGHSRGRRKRRRSRRRRGGGRGRRRRRRGAQSSVALIPGQTVRPVHIPHL